MISRSISLFVLVANNELPPPSNKVPGSGSSLRPSSGKQSYSNRYSRHQSRQESTSIKSQQRNILETDENAQKNADKTIQIITDTTENANQNQQQEDELVAGSSDCSIM
jgi:hypothetical protein